MASSNKYFLRFQLIYAGENMFTSTNWIKHEEVQFSAILHWPTKIPLIMALWRFLFWEKNVVLHANAKPLTQWLTYLSGPCNLKLLRIGKVSVTASDVRNAGKNQFSYMKSKFRNIYGHQWEYKNLQSFKDANVTIPAKGPAYLWRVSCLMISLHFVLWLELFYLSFL